MFWKIQYLLLAAALHLSSKVRALPYAPDDQGGCWINGTYFNKEEKLCCSLCAPGFHLKEKCTPTKDTVCEECKKGFHSNKLNYFHQCFKCSSCSEDKGLEYVQSCTTASDAKCACKEGMYCSYKLSHNCRDCTRFTTCPPGQGVSMQGTADSDVRCSPCTAGTFSDKKSYTEPCRPHTDCESQGRSALRPGNATSDTVCGQIMRLPFTTTTATTTTTAAPTPTSTPSKAFSQPAEHMPNTTSLAIPNENRKPEPGENIRLIAMVTGFGAGAVLLIALMICIHICIRNRRGDTNNNIDKEANKPLQGPSMSCQRSSSSSRPPEQQCLLGEKDSSSTSISTTSSKTESMVCCRSGYGGQEGSGGLYQRQDSPQMSSPTVTVNINATINCHLPTGTHFCSVPASPSTDSAPSDCNLPLSTEEERSDLSLLKVREAKDARPAVQESGKVVC
ncbi:hypothetical protein MATL_G00113330 [Megalops atlanticus]|uniref:TNFR-Cys domain-containing protein n=1 Tax=Megalops atlanticus TaxID=7932 RepID=A0A9D3Q5B4_MEGAT|nr:hypothetical protein MATL_G00113330 [Megalops atlanticus]